MQVTVLRAAVQQARINAEIEANRRRNNGAKAVGEDGLAEENNWISDEWILDVDVHQLTPASDNWEDVLRKYLDFAAQQALTKRLEFVTNREFAKLSRDHQPCLEQPFKWIKDNDPLTDKHHMEYEESFAYTGDDGVGAENEIGEGGGGLVKSEGGGGMTGDAKPTQARESAGTPPLQEVAVGGAAAAGADAAETMTAGGDDMDLDEDGDGDGTSGGQLPYTFAELKALLVSIVQITKEAHDNTRSRAELFFDLPSKEQYPDYYEIVKSPISMRDIIDKTEQGGYSTPESFRDDWLLLQENAYAYNPEGSVLRNDADFFVTVVQQKLAQFEALKREEASGGKAGKMIMRMNGLRIPDLSGIARGAVAGFQAPLEVTLEVLAFLIDESLSAEPTRLQLDNILEQANIVRTELREEQMAVNQLKNQEKEKIKEEAAKAEAAVAAKAEALANGEDYDEPELPAAVEEAPVDPLAGLRAANDELAMKDTMILSRQELVLHNKSLKESTDRLRREEIALENAAKKEQAAERKKQIDQKKKMMAFFQLLEELQVRGKALGFDRDRNRYWLLRPREPATIDDSLLFVELNRGGFSATSEFCNPEPLGDAEILAANGNMNSVGAPLSERWVQITSEQEFQELVNGLEPKVCRPLGLLARAPPSHLFVCFSRLDASRLT